MNEKEKDMNKKMNSEAQLTTLETVSGQGLLQFPIWLSGTACGMLCGWLLLLIL